MEGEQRSEGKLLQSETHETTNNTAKTEHDLSSELPIDLSELYGLCMKDIKNRETMRLLKHEICSFGGGSMLFTVIEEAPFLRKSSVLVLLQRGKHDVLE